jgi:hypothetical protein
VSSESAGHWQRIYQTRPTTEVSWYELVPQTSLDLIRATGLPASAPIIDVGSGDSHLVDHLLESGYSDVTVLDIAASALERARARLAAAAETFWDAVSLTRTLGIHGRVCLAGGTKVCCSRLESRVPR